MLVTILFALEGVGVLGGAVGLAWWLRRRLAVRWAAWTWGAMAFGGAYLVRIPLLLILTPMISGEGAQSEWQFWVNLLLLGLTAALIEETTRYVTLRWLARDTHGWQGAVMFGAGYGTIEAILLIVPTVISSLQLLLNGDALLAQASAVAPQQAVDLAYQIDNLRNTAWWMPVLAVWERIAAICFHIAASILIMQAVNAVSRAATKWWSIAVLYHLAFVTLSLVMQLAGPGAPEFTSTIFLVISLYLIRRYRPDPAARHST